MPKANRRSGITTLEAFFCIAALLGVVVIGYALGRVSGVGTERNRAESREHQATKQNTYSSCVNGSSTAMMECVVKAVEVKQSQSETRQALYAQQDAAAWAYWAMLASWASLTVALIGVWFVKGTLEATLVAVEDTGEATKAMVRQNEIAESSQRPWVNFTPIKVERIFVDGSQDRIISVYNPTLVECSLSYDLVCWGSSPAHDVFWTTALWADEEDYTVREEIFSDFRDRFIKDSETRKDKGRLMFPNESSKGVIRMSWCLTKPIDYISIYFQVLISYRDQTGAIHTTTVKYQVRLDDNGWLRNSVLASLRAKAQLLNGSMAE